MIPIYLSLSHAAIKSYDCHEAIPIGASLSDWALAAAADDVVEAELCGRGGTVTGLGLSQSRRKTSTFI